MTFRRIYVIRVTRGPEEEKEEEEEEEEVEEEREEEKRETARGVHFISRMVEYQRGGMQLPSCAA